MPSFLSINSFSFLDAFSFVLVCDEKYSARNLVSMTSFKLVLFSEFVYFFLYFFWCTIRCVDSSHVQKFWYRLE